jgi:restriction system protein
MKMLLKLLRMLWILPLMFLPVIFLVATVMQGGGPFRIALSLVCTLFMETMLVMWWCTCGDHFTSRGTQRRHLRYRRTARRVLARLKELDGDGQRLVYLRKISPYVLEELLLTAFEQQGHEVIRNPSYSGDGGIDGQVLIDGRTWLIQAKRYSRSISPQHVSAFIRLLESRNQPGFFIHTGRTGPASRALSRDCSLLRIISGQQLLDLLAGLPLKENIPCVTH